MSNDFFSVLLLQDEILIIILLNIIYTEENLRIISKLCTVCKKFNSLINNVNFKFLWCLAIKKEQSNNLYSIKSIFSEINESYCIHFSFHRPNYEKNINDLKKFIIDTHDSEYCSMGVRPTEKVKKFLKRFVLNDMEIDDDNNNNEETEKKGKENVLMNKQRICCGNFFFANEVVNQIY